MENISAQALAQNIKQFVMDGSDINEVYKDYIEQGGDTQIWTEALQILGIYNSSKKKIKRPLGCTIFGIIWALATVIFAVVLGFSILIVLGSYVHIITILFFLLNLGFTIMAFMMQRGFLYMKKWLPTFVYIQALLNFFDFLIRFSFKEDIKLVSILGGIFALITLTYVIKNKEIFVH